MDQNRRGFLKRTGLSAGSMLLTGLTGYASEEHLRNDIKGGITFGKNRKQVFNMCNYAAPAIPVVRVGIIGMGNRGGWACTRMRNIKNVEIRALCDIRESAVKLHQQKLKEAQWPVAAEYHGSLDAYKKLCERDDIDLVYIATPWEWHVPMAVYAMEQGKHAAVEVPAARNLEEAWQLVETSERTRKHCMQLENCCYDFFETMTITMAQQGLFGELIHGEGAYIHTLLEYMFAKPAAGDAPVWRWKENQHSGNLYPTHGLGPVAQAMAINRGDQFSYLSSMSSNDFMMEALASKLASGPDPYYKQFGGKHYRGNMNTSMIKTHKGKTILVQHDVSTPRPYSRIHLLSGTKGMAQKWPEPGRIAMGHEFVSEQTLKQYEELYSPEVVKHVAAAARKIGGHGGMDFIMDWRLIDCLRNGLPLDMDVYDAAAWSAVTPLSIWSVAHRSNSIEFPDFTGGSWKQNKPIDLSLRGGGNTAIQLSA